MPVITLSKDRFSKFIGNSITVEEMAKWLPWAGFDIEDVGLDYVKVEFNPNRIDFSSTAGVARAFSGLREWETGLPKYKVMKGKVVLNVDSSVSEVRPYVLAAIIRNMRLDDYSVRGLMEMQEDLHWGVGRDRRKVSIGVHNMDVVQPPFSYVTSAPNAVRFVPLDKMEEMSLQEILKKHEKGVGYSHLVDWASKYPLIIDSQKKVLSFPPIINGELTKVDSHAQNLFIEITGTDYNAIARSLNVLVTALSDMGGTVESVRVNYPDRTVVSPDLLPQRMMLRIDYANELLGLKLSESKVIRSLRKSRLDAKKINKGVLEVSIPAYRIDIMHEIDLVEEVAVGYGYFRLKPTKPATITTGKQHGASEKANHVRQIMIGLGFIEAMNFILTNEVVHFEKMRQKVSRYMVKLANPVSTENSIARVELLPSLMKNLADNKHESYPQRLFEVSDVIRISGKTETRSERRLHIAGVCSNPAANFTEIKSIVEALLADLNVKRWKVKTARNPSFLEGRAATIHVKNRKVGILGEVHPEVITNFELENPVSAFEIDLEEV
jgi:phenylalanyl-tRNA synthetase beta chain